MCLQCEKSCDCLVLFATDEANLYSNNSAITREIKWMSMTSLQLFSKDEVSIG